VLLPKWLLLFILSTQCGNLWITLITEVLEIDPDGFLCVETNTSHKGFTVSFGLTFEKIMFQSIVELSLTVLKFKWNNFNLKLYIKICKSQKIEKWLVTRGGKGQPGSWSSRCKLICVLRWAFCTADSIQSDRLQWLWFLCFTCYHLFSAADCRGTHAAILLTHHETLEEKSKSARRHKNTRQLSKCSFKILPTSVCTW